MVLAADSTAAAQDYLRLSKWCYNAGISNLTIAGCDAVIEQKRQTPERIALAYHNRALARLKEGRPKEAIADFDAVLAADPRNADCLFGRGLARRRLKDQTGGEADIAAAKAIRPAIEADFAKYEIEEPGNLR